MVAGSRPTQRDVAQRAGVSVATVSYVLGRRRHGAGPTAATRDRVLRAVDELGYQMDGTARSLRRGRTDVVAVVHPAPSSPWLDELVAQLQVAAAPRGHSVVVMPLLDDPVIGADPGRQDGADQSVPRLLRERAVDGAIVTPGCPLRPADLSALAAAGLAVVLFDDLVEPAGFDVVRQQRQAAWQEAVDHVLDRGHRRVAYLGHRNEPDSGTTKLAALRRTTAMRGVPLDPGLLRPVADSRADAHEAARDLLRLPDPPTAVLAATDRAAIDTIWAAYELGLRVPDDLCVLGVGNIAEGEAVTPRLTTVGSPTLDFSPVTGRLFERLDHLAQGEPAPLDIEIADRWRLIRRQSA